MSPTTILLPTISSPERNRLMSVDLIRRRALDRLYQRKAAVEDLIQALEDYQRAESHQKAECIDFSVARKCS
jgi:hypothetical protein